jgi:predicted alpha/beta hydrolase
MDTFTITKPNGKPLIGTVFTPALPNGRTLLISSATAVKQQFYYPFAVFCASKGYHVYTFDYSDIGRSLNSSLKNSDTTYSTWAVEDVSLMAQYLSGKYPEQPLYVIGHSSGGHLLGMSPIAHEFQAIVTIGSQQGFWRNYPLWYKWLVYLAFTVSMPLLTRAFGYLPSRLHGLGEDLPKGVFQDWQTVLLNPKGVESLMQPSAAHYHTLEKNMLVLSFEDDLLAPKKSVDRLAEEMFTAATITRRHIIPKEFATKSIGHFGFFRKKFQSTLWQIPLEWLELLHQTKFTISSSHSA